MPRLRPHSALVLLAVLCPSLLIASPATVPASQFPERTVHVAEQPLKLTGATPLQLDLLKPFAPDGAGTFDVVLRDTIDDPEDGWRFVRASYASPFVTPWPE